MAGPPAPTGALPVVGLVLTGSGAELVPLLAAMRRWCRPVALRPTSLRGAAREADPPAAAVALLHDTVPEQEPDQPWAVVSRSPAVLAAAGTGGVHAPDGDVPPGSAVVAPFVRERLRAARGLPSKAVLRRTAAGWFWPGRDEPLAGDLVPTALGCCAALALHEQSPDPVADLGTALAWGTPVATTRGVLVGSGAVGGEHAVAVPADVDAVAGLLADDARTASRLSWAGHRWWQERHDAAWVAASLALRLLPSTRLAAELRMAELGTPADAEIQGRWRAARL